MQNALPNNTFAMLFKPQFEKTMAFKRTAMRAHGLGPQGPASRSEQIILTANVTISFRRDRTSTQGLDSRKKNPYAPSRQRRKRLGKV